MGGDGSISVGSSGLGGITPTAPKPAIESPVADSHGRKLKVVLADQNLSLTRLEKSKHKPADKEIAARKVEVEPDLKAGYSKLGADAPPASRLAQRSQSPPAQLSPPTPEQLLGGPLYSVDDSLIDRTSTTGKDNPFLASEGIKLKPGRGTKKTESLPRKRRSLGDIAKTVKIAKVQQLATGKGEKLSDHVLIGIDKVANYENQGIPREYLEKMQTVADEQDTIVAIRPVEIICRTLIEEGAESKGLNIKGKSSNWGPMAGFIPFDQQFSKVAAIKDPIERSAAIEKYNEKNQTSIKDGFASIEQLSLSQRRLDELTGMGILQGFEKTAPTEGYKDAVRFSSHPKGGADQVFEAQQKSDGKWDVFSGTGEVRKKLEVIPKTADFDLLFTFSPYDKVDLGSTDRMHGFDAKLGVYSDRNLKLINALNTEFDRGEGKDMVHHGTDINNPVTDMDANLPATIVIPKSMISKMGIYQESPLLIKNYGELEKLFRTMRDAGIRVESNPLWDKMTNVVKESFNKKVDFFERRSSLSPSGSTKPKR